MQQLTKFQAQDILGVSEFATQKDIRTAWRALVFDIHPDMRNGNNDEFARVQMAYERLRRRPQNVDQIRREYDPSTDAPIPGMEAGAAMPRRPARHEIRTRIEELSPAARALCETILRDGCDERTLDKTIAAGGFTAEEEAEIDNIFGHVPSAIRRKGRRVSYFVKAPLTAGQNRVAVPTTLEDTRKPKAKLMTFDVAEDGAGLVEVPDHVRDRMFPGTRSVRIHFEDTKAS
ncbi:J domain-containing protein [Ovoidimarina sediminis]|uniref:J domain-containing protein n=1 Tax=Ovoidimarina sediminis TaxID=3079856 RepID=UPI002910BD2D|nr:J domain-containing protein [Rhodophyticola sp. MJ-SS7]MDU8942363.1 J domain-containing protein [Rhodophyticola sp. MJ-SS7]